jgi:PAS domain S-box-containing protein
MQKEKYKMEKLNLELIDIKNLFDYISEPVIITDKQYNIVLINDMAIEKLLVSKEEAMVKKLRDYIPIDSLDAVCETLQNTDAKYFEIEIKNGQGGVFPALASGQIFPLQDDTYGILTIVDLTSIKEQEAIKLKKLKSHIISQATHFAQKENAVKGEETMIKIDLQNKIDELNHQIFKLERKVTLFERENQSLNYQFDKIQENSFSFEQILDREIAMATRYDTKFSLAIVAIHDFKEFTEKVDSQYKTDLILRAFKKHFRSSVRTTDVIYYENSGLFYLILPNSADVNITDLVKRLLRSKRIDTDIVVEFDCGMAHFYPNDTREQLIYRAKKNLDINIKENNIVRSK